MQLTSKFQFIPYSSVMKLSLSIIFLAGDNDIAIIVEKDNQGKKITLSCGGEENNQIIIQKFSPLCHLCTALIHLSWLSLKPERNTYIITREALEKGSLKPNMFLTIKELFEAAEKINGTPVATDLVSLTDFWYTNRLIFIRALQLKSAILRVSKQLAESPNRNE